MDDGELFDRFLLNPYALDLKNLFFPESAGRYFRPLLTLSYYLDSRLWGMSVQGYHFINYLFHLFNSALVYQIALALFGPEKNRKSYAAFSMLIFGLHPLTCESVAWVSGRSDILGAFFPLAAIAVFLTRTPYRYFLAPAILFLGLLCKENALSGIPILVLLAGLCSYADKKTAGQALKSMALWCVLMLIPFALYMFMRTGGFEQTVHTSVAQSVISTAVRQGSGGGSNLFLLFSAAGFYLKKLIIPFPLNFAISSIQTGLYAFVSAGVSVIGMVLLIKKKYTPFVWILILVLSFVPSLPVALGKIAWVPFAERYLYLSCSMFAIALMMVFIRIEKSERIGSKTLLLFCIAILLVFSTATFKRQAVWKNSRNLWTDTLAKNPESSMVFFKYGQAFSGEKRIQAYEKALELEPAFKYRSDTLLGLAKEEISRGNISIAVAYTKKALSVKPSHKNYIKAASFLAAARQPQTQGAADTTALAIEYYETAYKKRKNDFVLYRIGVLSNQSGRTQEAIQAFEKLIKNHPKSKYAAYAEKQMNRSDL